MNKSNGKKEEPKSSFFIEFTFLSFGVSTLLCWNTILTDIGFFITYQSAYKVDVLYPFLANILSLTLQVFMLTRNSKVNYKRMLIIGVLGSIIILVSLPFTVLLFEKNSKQGFLLSSGLIFFMGFINAICNRGYLGFTSYFPGENMGYLSTGQGLSGILPNIIQFIVVYLVNTGNPEKDLRKGAVVFFFISAGIYLLCLILLFAAFKTEYFQYYLKGIDAVSEESEKLIESSSDEPKKSKGFCDVFKLIKNYVFLTILIYIVTFVCFPSVSIRQRLFDFDTYRIVTIITAYNIFDTIGRILVNHMSHTKTLAYTVVISRVILVVLLPLNYALDLIYKVDIKITSWLLVLLVGLLAATNGMGTTLMFSLAPGQVPNELKGQAASSIGLFIVVGIVGGTCCGFISGKVMDMISQAAKKKL